MKVRRKIMPYMEDVEEAREKIVVLNTDVIGDEIVAANAQENEECNELEDEIHPDHETLHPDFLNEGRRPPRACATSYKKVDLWDKKTIRKEICKLDSDQRHVLDLFIMYARSLKLAKK